MSEEAPLMAGGLQDTGNPLLDTTANIVSAAVSQGRIKPDDIAAMIEAVHEAILRVAQDEPGGLARRIQPESGGETDDEQGEEDWDDESDEEEDETEESDEDDAETDEDEEESLEDEEEELDEDESDEDLDSDEGSDDEQEEEESDEEFEEEEDEPAPAKRTKPHGRDSGGKGARGGRGAGESRGGGEARRDAPRKAARRTGGAAGRPGGKGERRSRQR